MKLISFAVPCYNSAEYMRKCIDSLLAGGDEVEILVIDDGSTDGTARIADEYVADYPGIVRVIHQENGGHGAAVNTGLANASGIYFKVVDSDDWVKESAYRQILGTLHELTGGDRVLDMLVSNFVYEKAGEKHTKVMRYRHALPEGTIFTWGDVHHFFKGQYILMHSVIFRTKLLRECGLRLPEHMFYVDNLYVFEPLPFVKNMYYLDVNFYRYYIGRADQSVNEQIMISRIDQQIAVNKRMVDYFVANRGRIQSDKRCRAYMLNYLEIITTISTVLAIKSGTEENLAKRRELWEYIKAKDLSLFIQLRYGFLCGSTNLPGRGGRRISVSGYRLAQKVFKFN